ncbi:class D sortase [Halobacillus sp. BBL2006]|uniref:class D sortase n=1 Tax=Halobacillus sp. BBL2006 TaxID=1543706 RepID=UPI000543F9CB|nr:class D sortase [Halobacillus sp. BBL2006]KHE67653.1 sortase [Halobacillus sp. BBL2006]
MHKGKKMRKYMLLFLSLTLLIGGLWFTTTSAYTFAKGYFLFKTGTATAEKSRQETTSKESEPAAESETKALPEINNEVVSYESRPKQGERMGELYIPKLDATLPIFHGTDEDELDKGVGHFAGSVLPGEKDNAVLSGHRDTVFRRLGEVGVNDLLIVTTSAGEFTYKVRKVRIVDADDRTVIVPKPTATLTVTTCYPFDFVGSAPERYILVAELKSSKK